MTYSHKIKGCSHKDKECFQTEQNKHSSKNIRHIHLEVNLYGYKSLPITNIKKVLLKTDTYQS